MTSAITFWLHILAVAIFVGPQFFLFLASMPAIKVIEDRETRLRVMRVMTKRFGYIAMAAMLLILLTGMSNVGSVQSDTGINILSPEFRYSWIFTAKMVMVAILVLFTGAHAMFIGPRLLKLQEDAREGVKKLRTASIVISALNLLLAVGIIYTASVLAQHDFSLRPI